MPRVGFEPLWLSQYNLYVFLFTPIRAICPAHLIVLQLIILIILWRRVQITKLLIMEFFSSLLSIHPSLVKIFSSAPCSQTPSAYVSPLVSETRFRTHFEGTLIYKKKKSPLFSQNICLNSLYYVVFAISTFHYVSNGLIPLKCLLSRYVFLHSVVLIASELSGIREDHSVNVRAGMHMNIRAGLIVCIEHSLTVAVS
jgi:hypothetical protein